jgi:hypothetical protein
MTVHVEWANAANDRDVYVLDATGAIVSQSAAYGDADEDAVLVDPPPGTYTAVVVNDDQVDRRLDDWRGEVLFASPNPTTYAPRRAGTFRCETPSGTRAERAARHEGGGDAESDDTQPSGGIDVLPPSLEGEHVNTDRQQHRCTGNAARMQKARPRHVHVVLLMEGGEAAGGVVGRSPTSRAAGAKDAGEFPVHQTSIVAGCVYSQGGRHRRPHGG